MSAVDLAGIRQALLAGGVAVLPTDTVYGLAAALDVPEGVDRLYAVKGRPRSQPCQVLIYSRRVLEDAIGRLSPPVAAVCRALLPGPVTCIVADGDARFAAAAGHDPGSVGLRAPVTEGMLTGLDLPLVATSANEPGEADPASVEMIPRSLRDACAVVLDVGWLRPVPSAVVDLRPVDHGGEALLVRPGSDPDGVAARVRAAGALAGW